MVGMDNISSSEFLLKFKVVNIFESCKQFGSLHLFLFLMNFPYVKLVIYALRLKMWNWKFKHV